MKVRTLFSVCLLVITAERVTAQTNKVATNDAPPKLRTLTTSSTAAKTVPTAEEIKAFVSEYKETENSKELLSLRVSLGVPKLSAEQKKKFERSKKVPYQLQVDLIKTKEVNGKKVSTRVTDGKCNYAILDDTEKVIKHSSENLIKLCAS